MRCTYPKPYNKNTKVMPKLSQNYGTLYRNYVREPALKIRVWPYKQQLN